LVLAKTAVAVVISRLSVSGLTSFHFVPHDCMRLFDGVVMLKEVGSSGQISLGKRFAGQLFEVTFHGDGRVEMVPMQAVPLRRAAASSDVPAPDAWLPPGGYLSCNAWALENRAALEAYAQRTEQHGTAAEQLQAFLATPPVVSDA
jgi:hypothetical protein